MGPTDSLLQKNGNELRARVAKFGLAAVLAYGLFDGVTYTTFFVAAFLGYEKSTGLNPTANLKALLGVSMSPSARMESACENNYEAFTPHTCLIGFGLDVMNKQQALARNLTMITIDTLQDKRMPTCMHMHIHTPTCVCGLVLLCVHTRNSLSQS